MITQEAEVKSNRLYFAEEAPILKNERMSFSEWRVGRAGQFLLERGRTVAMNCLDGAVIFGTLLDDFDYGFHIGFPDGDEIEINAYEAYLRDLRPA